MQRILGNPPFPSARVSGSMDSFRSTDNRLSRSSTLTSTSEHLHYSPLNRLPVELHAEIFSHCLNPFPQLNAYGKTPMVIACVCSSWRALVLSTPRLWASFEIEVQDSLEDSPGAQNAIRLLNSVKIWLERSRNYPLSIRLVHVPTDSIPGHLSAQVLAMLVSHARRWRHVEFTLPSTSLSAVQGIFPEDFPALKHLTVHMKGQWNYGHNLPSVNFMRMMKIPWTQLTEVDLRLDHSHLLNLDEYLDLLSAGTNLIACSFNANCVLRALETASSIGSSNGSARRKRDRLHLPALESLHLVLQGGQNLLDAQQQRSFLRPGESLTSFLDLFSECNLTRLELDWLVDSPGNGIQWEASSYSSFRSLLRALSPTLRSIRLAYLPLGENELLQSLAQLSIGSGESTSPSTANFKLSDLDLRFSLADQEQDPVTDRFLRSLSVLPPTAPVPQAQAPGERRWNVNPQLESNIPAIQLQLHGLERIHIQCSGERCSQRALLELLKSRTQRAMRAKGFSLKQFHLYSMSPLMGGVAQQVDDWAKAGVDVKLESVVIL